jgi:hypothetical protein
MQLPKIGKQTKNRLGAFLRVEGRKHLSFGEEMAQLTIVNAPAPSQT